ncbi:MAG: PqqD family protein [Caldilineaceae bacterium]|nr:PqqD family protein [Caldilineaceae bacterium]
MKRQIPKQISNYYLEVLNDEFLLYHPGRNQIYQINATAALIWQLCNGERSIDEIDVLLLAAYPTAGKALMQDTHETIQQLATQGVIELV